MQDQGYGRLDHHNGPSPSPNPLQWRIGLQQDVFYFPLLTDFRIDLNGFVRTNTSTTAVEKVGAAAGEQYSLGSATQSTSTLANGSVEIKFGDSSYKTPSFTLAYEASENKNFNMATPDDDDYIYWYKISQGMARTDWQWQEYKWDYDTFFPPTFKWHFWNSGTGSHQDKVAKYGTFLAKKVKMANL